MVNFHHFESWPFGETFRSGESRRAAEVAFGSLPSLLSPSQASKLVHGIAMKDHAVVSVYIYI